MKNINLKNSTIVLCMDPTVKRFPALKTWKQEEITMWIQVTQKVVM